MQYPESQQQAIDTIDRNLQIIACAGSGKTQVTSARIVEILRHGATPASIVAFTFTEKAAGELEDRIDRLDLETLGTDCGLGDMYIGTIHGYGFSLIQPPPAATAKPKSVPKSDLSAQPALVTDFTPSQGAFPQRLKRVMSLGQPQNQLELAELVASLGDENAQIRYFAGASLTRLGGLATVNMLAAYLQTNPTDLSRGEALKVLGMIGEMSEEPDVRTTAIQALATENS